MPLRPHTRTIQQVRLLRSLRLTRRRPGPAPRQLPPKPIELEYFKAIRVIVCAPLIKILDEIRSQLIRNNMLERQDATWNEADHPRDPQGRFSEGGSGAAAVAHEGGSSAARAANSERLGVTPEDHSRAETAFKDLHERATQAANSTEKMKIIKNTLREVNEEIERHKASGSEKKLQRAEKDKRELEADQRIELQEHINKEVSEHFKKQGLGEVHAAQYTGWLHSSNTDEAMQLHGALHAMGVSGTIPDKDMNSHFQKGEADPKLHAYVKELYAMNQAALKANGVTEVTLYRGVKGQLAGVAEGQEVKVATRPASSWTDQQALTKAFTEANPDSGVLSIKVPAGAVLRSHYLFGGGAASAEREYIVLGAASQKLTVASKAR